MARPLTGSVRQASPNSWEASVPERRGATKRITRCFTSESDAAAWLEVACAAVRDGLVVPEPVQERHWLAAVADTWHERVYVTERAAKPGRAEAVRRHLDAWILPYFMKRWHTPADVDADNCFQFVQYLAGLRTADGRLIGRTNGRGVKALRRTTQSNIVSVLKTVLGEAVVRRVIAFNPASSLGTVEPNATATVRTTSKKTVVCTLVVAVSIARGLHLLHQLALWLQRIVGLRISEVYGITVGDVIRDGDSGAGFVLISSQGGGDFDVWTDDGVERVRNVERLKTDQSYRVAAIPRPLMALIDVVIDAYHRDADGEVDCTAPLVPGIAQLDGGRDGYRTALKQASITPDDDYLCPHQLRASMVRDLTHKTEIPGEIRRLILGHLAGGDVHDRIYNGQSLDLAPMRGPRDEMEAIILDEIGSLLVPTEREVCFWNGHPMRCRMERAEQLLTGMGLLIIDRGGISTEEAGLRIGRSPQVVRRYLEDGLLKGFQKRIEGRNRWYIDEDSVVKFIERYADVFTYQDLEEELSMTTQQLRAAVELLGLEPVMDDATRRVLFTADDRHRLVDYRATVARVKERSVPLERAAEQLNRRRSTLQAWIGRGLDLDPEAASVGLRAYVTCASVERMRQELAASKTRSRSLPGRGEAVR